MSFQATKRMNQQEGRVASKHAGRQADRQASRQTGKQAGRQAGRYARTQHVGTEMPSGTAPPPLTSPVAGDGSRGAPMGVGATAGWLVVFAKIPQTT